MKSISDVALWGQVERPAWYEGGGDDEPQFAPREEFWAPVGEEWPLIVMGLYKIRPDGGVKPSFSFKLRKKDWFMEPENAGSGLPPQLARRMGEILIEYADDATKPGSA